MKFMNQRNRVRRQSGTELAEFGPALALVFLLIVFPMFNMIYWSVAYGTSWFLNHIVVHELALTNPNDLSAVNQAEQRVTNDWANLGLANFIGINPGNLTEKVQHSNLTYTPKVNPNFVSLTTTVSVKPFMPMPIFASVPGLGKDVVFTFNEQQTLEEKGLD